MFLKCIASGSSGNAYALIGEEEILLLECGIPLKEVKKAIDYQILKIKGCLVSHEHQDHLKYVREYLNAGIPVYTNELTKEKIQTKAGDQLHGIPEKTSFRVGGFKVIPFWVPHNDTPCFAYLIEYAKMGQLLFATDYEYLPWTFRQWEINHFLIECNYSMNFVDQSITYYEHILRGHASLQTCMEVIRKNRTPKLRNVILCHISQKSESGEYFMAEVEKVAGIGTKVCCATPGLSLELSKDPF
ncbi:MBL fold metallo-hydrolase [Enterocloster asparagiformis]|uniref:MBL fold metallo-hydrolase n=1 Tax=Enterocloster asparagiformis TaxID=333367 RepID=UPI00046723D6|nr:MBL fold metallo-hydrolase [Enterocloster asparagiformis]